MRDINVVVLVGRLTRDAELKYAKNGTAIVHFSIAVNRSRKQDDEWVDEPNFFDIDYFGKSAESVSKYLLKGQMIGVEGELRQDRWEQDGQARSKVSIVANNVKLLGSNPGSTGGGYAKPRTENSSSPSRVPEQTEQPDSVGFDDDIPF
ncbi:MAG: single-stranded DNA-binding protein [Spirochaetia bacterium]|nr:single-stranded DNA-binding protein [Spirochaetia bacterium]